MITDTKLEAKATRWGEAMGVAALTQTACDYILMTTYNEHLDVLPDAHIGTTLIPHVGWFGIGIGSDYMSTLTDPISGDIVENTTKYIHSNEDAIPFTSMPFVARKVGEDDLSAEERSKLGMRSIHEVDGVNYVLYWLKAAEVTTDKVTIEVVTKDTAGIITDVSELEPSADPLNPVKDANYLGEEVSSNSYIRVRGVRKLSLSPSDVAELLNVAAILYGKTDIDITEFALVGGIEQEQVVVDGSTNITYTEVIGAQGGYFSPVSFSASARLDVGIDLTFKMGQSLSVN